MFAKQVNDMHIVFVDENAPTQTPNANTAAGHKR